MNNGNKTSYSPGRKGSISLDECILQGFEWFCGQFLPDVRSNLRTHAEGTKAVWPLEVTGDVYFVVDCPHEALRWYRRAARKSRQRKHLDQQIAEIKQLLELRKANSESPISAGSTQADGEVTDCSDCLQVCEAIALGQPLNDVLAGHSQPQVRLVRSRWLFTTHRHIEAFREFYSVCLAADDLYLTAADWFYLPTSFWENVALWRALHRRWRTVRDLGLTNFDRSAQRVGPPELSLLYEGNPNAWGRKMRELVLRFHLFRSSSNRAGLEQLASKYPQWSDVNHSLWHFDQYGRAPLKTELLQIVQRAAGPRTNR